MYCLYCGDCCERMSPISQSEKCPYLVKSTAPETGSYFFCSIYEHRPSECKNHGYWEEFCPIGLDVTGLGKVGSLDRVRRRIDEGWAMLQELD